LVDCTIENELLKARDCSLLWDREVKNKNSFFSNKVLII
jgi:hypothetical protein